MVRTSKGVGRQDAATKEDGPKKGMLKEPHPQMGIKSTMKGENCPCSVLNCNRKAAGQSLGWRDQWGPPGLRCSNHGGGVTCCIPGCTRAMTQICTRNDDYGAKGPRCSEHLMRVVTDSVDHIPLDHYNEDGKRGDTDRGLKAPLINASEEKIAVGREDKDGALDDKNYGYVDEKGNPINPRKRTKPLLSKKIEDFQKCTIPNCQEFAKGDALQSKDQFGAPGYRCEKHGGYIACGVDGCNNPRWIIGTRADAWGKRGPRCSEHSQPVPSAMFPEAKQKKKKGDGMGIVSVELPKRTPKAENPGGGILPPAATPTAYGGPPKLGAPPPAPEVNVNEIEPPARKFVAHGPYMMPPVSPALIDELAGCRPKAGRKHEYPKKRASKKNRVDDWGGSPLPLKAPTYNGKVKMGAAVGGVMPIMDKVSNVPKATFSQLTHEPPKKKTGTHTPFLTGVRGRKKADSATTHHAPSASANQESGQSTKSVVIPHGIPLPASNPEAQGAAPPVSMAQKKKSKIPTQEDQASNQIASKCNVEGCNAVSAGESVKCPDVFAGPGYRCANHGGIVSCCVPNCVRPMFTSATKSDSYGGKGARCAGHSSAYATKQQLKIAMQQGGGQLIPRAGAVTGAAPSKGTKRSISSSHSPSSSQANESQQESLMKAGRPLKKQKQEVEATVVKGGVGAPKAAAMKKRPA